MESRAPFSQLPFASVPLRPRLPHPYCATEARSVLVESELGRTMAHVRVTGQGPPLFLIHGFMTTSYSWRYLLEPLGRHFRLYVPDLVGAGRSDKPDVDYHPDRIAAWIGALGDALGITGCAMIGNSMGGYLGMRLALQRPDAISRLVNLHSPGLRTGRNSALKWALRLVPGWQHVLRRVVQANPHKWVHRNVHYYDETLKSQEEHREYGDPLATPEGFTAFCHYLEDTMSADAMDAFESKLSSTPFPIPLQLIYARRDPMVPPEVGERLHALVPASELQWLDEASHFAHVDAPEAFLATALPFLKNA